jgi:hypothetical protein
VSEQEWLNSGINVAWLADAADDELIHRYEAAWDELQQQPAWREWLTTYRAEVKRPSNYLAEEDRAERRVKRKRNGDLDFHVPVAELVGQDSGTFQRLIRDVLTARAAMAKVPAPPT